MEAASRPQGVPPAQPGRRLLPLLWPAFLMAGVLEMLVFAVVDPQSLQERSGEALALSRNAIYSIAFLVFWAAIATSAAVTRRLDAPGRAPRFD